MESKWYSKDSDDLGEECSDLMAEPVPLLLLIKNKTADGGRVILVLLCILFCGLRLN